MATQSRARATVTVTAASQPLSAAFCTSLLLGCGDRIGAVAEAKAAVDVAIKGQLAYIVEQCAPLAPVNGKTWDERSSDAFAAFLAQGVKSGRWTLDDKGKSFSATSAFSAVKVAVLALTNKAATPKDGESLKSFVDRAREPLRKVGLLPKLTATQEAAAKRRKADAENRAASKGGAAPVSAPATVTVTQPLTDDADLQGMFADVAGDDVLAAMFKRWFAKASTMLEG